ncbi:unnamed protein product [Adineta steineri]|uniref:Apple domain-containing protein n=1 Tax=Adineta steineri TaxID=433720 RepID=A0A815NP18_9BILA|nr:unnamed protein product [Adineta steineri]CAF1434684.1 unnamed protein product [Adineta steineri]
MHSFTTLVVIIAFVAIVAKHSSVATHDSDTQELHRRLNGYNYGKDEQYNMFLRRVAQQPADDEANDESLHATMRKHVDSANWVKIGSKTYIGAQNCVRLHYEASTTLSSCKSVCHSMKHCTAIDYKPRTGECKYRKCTTYPPKHQSKHGWEAWAIHTNCKTIHIFLYYTLIATTTKTAAATPIPTCSPSACCGGAKNCRTCVYGGTTYYCIRYDGPTGYNLYPTPSACAADLPSPTWCDYQTTCGNGAGHPGLGSGLGC